MGEINGKRYAICLSEIKYNDKVLRYPIDIVCENGELTPIEKLEVLDIWWKEYWKRNEPK